MSFHVTAVHSSLPYIISDTLISENGPFEYNGNLYFTAVNVQFNYVQVFKSSDHGASWALCGPAGPPILHRVGAVDLHWQTISTQQQGSILWIFYRSPSAGGHGILGALVAAQFNMATDGWGTTVGSSILSFTYGRDFLQEALTGISPIYADLGFAFEPLHSTQLSNGEIWLTFNGELYQTGIAYSRGRAYYARFDGTAFSGPFSLLSDNPTADYSHKAGTLVAGDQDRVHFFYSIPPPFPEQSLRHRAYDQTLGLQLEQPIIGGFGFSTDTSLTRIYYSPASKQLMFGDQFGSGLYSGVMYTAPSANTLTWTQSQIHPVTILPNEARPEMKNIVDDRSCYFDFEFIPNTGGAFSRSVWTATRNKTGTWTARQSLYTLGLFSDLAQLNFSWNRFGSVIRGVTSNATGSFAGTGIDYFEIDIVTACARHRSGWSYLGHGPGGLADDGSGFSNIS